MHSEKQGNYLERVCQGNSPHRRRVGARLASSHKFEVYIHRHKNYLCTHTHTLAHTSTHTHTHTPLLYHFTSLSFIIQPTLWAHFISSVLRYHELHNSLVSTLTVHVVTIYIRLRVLVRIRFDMSSIICCMINLLCFSYVLVNLSTGKYPERRTLII